MGAKAPHAERGLERAWRAVSWLVGLAILAAVALAAVEALPGTAQAQGLSDGAPVIAASGATSGAQGASVVVDGQSYLCRPVPQAGRVVLPPGDRGAALTPALDRPICPSGEAPQAGSLASGTPAPTPLLSLLPRRARVLPRKPRVLPTRAHAAAPVVPPSGDEPYDHEGSEYFYAQEATWPQAPGATAFGGDLPVQSEELDPAHLYAGHSLDELWAIETMPGGEAYSDVEAGFITTYGLDAEPGESLSAEPILFVFHFDAGEPFCYDACGFVQVANEQGYIAGYPVPAASLLAPGEPQRIEIYEDPAVAGEWWVALDGVPVGYYPPSAWAVFDPTALNDLQAGGEVASPDLTPDVSMGDGYLGTDAREGPYAPATITSLTYEDGGEQTPESVGLDATAPAAYDASQVPAQDISSYPTVLSLPAGTPWSFSFGGPGFCAVPSLACSAQTGVPAALSAPYTYEPPQAVVSPAAWLVREHGHLVLTSAPGTWEGASGALAFQWQERTGGSWVDLARETGPVLYLHRAWLGSRLRMAVTARDVGGEAVSASRGVLVPAPRRPSSHRR
jgi:hypothetical protein